MIRFRRRFPWVSFRGLDRAVSSASEPEPLREFVYLDEVSLASLLASQKGELTENVTAQSQDLTLAEVGGKVGMSAPLLPSAETMSRFQTSNSSSLQTLRKANAQSLFRELHRLEHLRRIRPVKHHHAIQSIADLLSAGNGDMIYKASELKRGDLVEFRVKLSASWIFQVSTMVAEFSDMFDESPALFMNHVKFSDLYQAKNANKIVNRLLAGLVPVDGLVSDYSVFERAGTEYIVNNEAVSSLGLDVLPLQIVGVTEHLAYWKDIRRVLFADNEFTILCRLSKPGIQRKWNPIKLADIFKEFAPDLANQLEQSTRFALTQSLQNSAEERLDQNSTQLVIALSRYKDGILALSAGAAPEKLLEIDRLMSNLRVNGQSAEGQRIAFSEVKSLIESVTGQQIDPEADLSMRQQVRQLLNLPLFPQISEKEDGTETVQPELFAVPATRLLDVEVVAIYW